MRFRISSRAALGLVLLGAVLLLGLGSSSVPLLDPDESRFARTSVEMLRSSDIVVPHFEGRPRLVKPPLVHWIQIFLFQVFGPEEWAARLHAALATLGSIALVGWVGRRRFGELGGVWAAVLLATMPLVLVPGKIGTLDALLAVHVLAVVALDLAMPHRGDVSRPLVLGGLLGLAFLTKGPVGVVVPLLILLAGRTAAGLDVAPSLATITRAVAAWCAVVLPWGLAFLHRVGGSAVGGTLREEVLERYFAGTLHIEPPWYYGKVAAVGFLPWVAPLIVALARVWRLRRDPASKTARYAAGGLVAGLIFFSMSPSKLATYILPLAPLAALLLTWELAREMEAPERRTLGPNLLAATAAAVALLLGLGSVRLEGELRIVALAGAAIHGVAAIVAAHGALTKQPQRVWASVAAAAGAFLLVVVIVVFPGIGRERSAAELIARVPELREPGSVVTVEIRVPSLTFYLDRNPEILEMSELAARLDEADRALFVLADVDLPSIPPETRPRLHELGRHGKLVVFRPTGSE